MEEHYCPVCCIEMVPEWDDDFDLYIWTCPDCGETYVEGE